MYIVYTNVRGTHKYKKQTYYSYSNLFYYKRLYFDISINCTIEL